MKQGSILLSLVMSTVLAGFAQTAPPDLAPLFSKIKAVGPEGKGNAEAADSWKKLTDAGIDALLPTLTACDGADRLALNWLLSAAETVAEREATSGKILPLDQLETFVKDIKHNGSARRLAYELIEKEAPTRARLLSNDMLEDPAPELRRDAVAVVIDAAKALGSDDKTAARKMYHTAFNAARDRDQVDAIAKALKALGDEVDLATHYGFVRDWMTAVPFDNTEGKGFHVVLAPEKGVDLSAVYKGKDNTEARWTAQASTDAYGMMDLNKLLGKQKGTTAFAYTIVESPDDRDVQVRVGCINSIKVIVNGKELLSREECHHGTRMDQHILPTRLKKGKNEILVKVSQNEQTEQWAQNWGFQLRLCDALGGAAPFKVVLPETRKDPEDKKENQK
jgi:hypothetical protein